MQDFAIRLRDALVRIEQFVCSITVFSLVMIVAWGVVERYILRWGTGWTDELSRYVCIWAMMIGAGLGVVRGAHVGVEVFVRMLPKKFQLFIEFVSYILCIIFTIALSCVGVEYFEKLIKTHQLTPTLEFPIAYAYLAIPAGAMLMSLHYLIKIVAFKAEHEEARAAAAGEDNA